MKTDRIRISKYFVIGLLFVLIISCSKEPDEPASPPQSTDRQIDYYLGLGKKLKNPYLVENMKIALDRVNKRTKSSRSAKNTDGFTIETSHLYVKIDPKDAAEEALLKRNTTQVFFDYPLDYEFPEEVLKKWGTNDADVIGSYYAAVPKDYVFPAGIKKEVLAELYIPEQDPYFEDAPETGNINKKTIENKEDLLGNLLIEAYTLTQNEAQLNIESTSTGKTSRWIFGKKWRPSGRITMQDNSLHAEVPVDGAQILIRQWFTVDSGITDANGNFSTGTVRGKARYIIQWERKHYDIRNGWFGQAETRGPEKRNEPWNFNITDEDDTQFAMIHRAAHHYYYKDIKELRRPPLDGDIPSRMKIAAIQNYNNDLNGDHSFWRGIAGVLPTIRIYKRTLSKEYYGTTIHELAHSSHWKMAWWTYEQTEDKVRESWARGVQWELSRMVYLDFDNKYFDNYTGVVEDMIDSDNSPSDDVSGYTIAEIENSLKDQKTWEGWRDKIMNDHNNLTENNLPTLFNYWN